MRFGPFSLALVGCAGDQIIEKKANVEPSIVIVSHAEETTVPINTPIQFWAAVSDDDNDWDELQITWYISDQDASTREVCPPTVANTAGESICTLTFVEGDVNVIAEVRDPYNATGQDDLSIVIVENEIPEVEIIAPTPNSVYSPQQTIQFVGVVLDAEDSAADLLISWSSSLDGALSLSTTPDASGEISDYLSLPLSVGEHIITLQATDTMGAVASDDVLITIEAQNTPPSCGITAPSTGSSYAVGAEISFTATVADNETAATSLSSTWSSSWDGPLGQGTLDANGTLSLNISSLSANNHLITLSVEDGAGGSCQDSINVLVGSPPSVSDVEIVEAPYYNDQELTCQATVTDPDDIPTVSYVWSSGSTILSTSTGDTIDLSQENLAPGDELTCTVEATDSMGSSAQGSATITIENRIPSVSDVQISGDPYNDQTLTCRAGSSADAEDGTPTLSYAWSSAGNVLGNASTIDLDTTAVMPEDVIRCTITATDSFGDSAEDFAEIRIANRPPSVPTVTVTGLGADPSTPLEGDSLVCQGTGSTDPDDQTVSYEYAWSSSPGTTASGDTLSGSLTTAGDVWTCTVTASDGDLSASASASIEIDCAFAYTFETISLGNSVDVELVKICAGTFMMGSPTNEEGRNNDETQHEVVLTNDFYAMTTEVTQGMFQELMGYESHTGKNTTEQADGNTFNESYGVGADYPAYHVNWHMAADFANALTQQHNSIHSTTLQECYSCSGSDTTVSCTQTMNMNPYDCDGYRLLTEAEWEYSARAGSTDALWTPNGGGNIPSGASNADAVGCSPSLMLSDGSILDSLSWFCGNSLNDYVTGDYGSKVVMSKIENAYGLWDMHGNVYEWVHDNYASYPTSSVTDPVNPSGSEGIFRGGAWGDGPSGIRSAQRRSYDLSIRNEWTYPIGFRIGRSAL